MQLRLTTKLTPEAYVAQAAQIDKGLSPKCPWHPAGGCGWRRHGFYARQQPEIQVARWKCHKSGRTVSFLPDFAAARLSGTLADVEVAVDTFAQARAGGDSVAVAAQALRPEIGLQGALRWIARRRHWVEAALVLLVGCAPTVLEGRPLQLGAARAALATRCVLAATREIADANLQHAAAPVGFRPGSKSEVLAELGLPHEMGADLLAPGG